MNYWIFGCVLIVLLSMPPETESNKWSRLPKKVSVPKPITGKFNSETADRYYNSPRVSDSHFHPIFFPCMTCNPVGEFQGAKIIKSSHFNLVYVLGHKIVFLCVAQGKPNPTITWFKDGVELFGHKYMQV